MDRERKLDEKIHIFLQHICIVLFIYVKEPRFSVIKAYDVACFSFSIFQF